MASVFLSYARADAAMAGQLARTLERAGHQVWWDKQIHGGARYSREIQEALDRADSVLVLWSNTSIGSDWVQDEAVVGRDSGRLVPVAIEAVEPPLGFRQFQTIDLSRWKGRAAPKPVLQAIAAVAPGEADGQEPESEPQSWRPKLPRAAVLTTAGLAAVLLLIAGWQLLGPRSVSNATVPTLAVLPFADLSPEGDKAYFSEGVGEAILSLLAREPGIKVIGRSSAGQFRAGTADFREVRKALRVTHFLEGSARTAGEELRMSVRLIDASDGTQVWAEDYQRRLSNIFAVQDEIGRAVAERLKGTLARPAARARQQIAAVDTYTLYLALRAKMRQRDPRQLNEALELARRINEANPSYAPAYAARAELIYLLSTENYGTLPRSTAIERALPFARRAVELDSDGAEGHAALGLLLQTVDAAAAIAPLSRAIALDPSRAEIRLWRGRSYLLLGRDSEALADLRAVVEMEPLWGVGQLNLVAALATAGQHSEAEAVIERFEARGGSPAHAAFMKAVNTFLAGDLSQSVRGSLQVRRLGLAQSANQEFLSWMLHLASFNGAAANQVSERQPSYARLYVSGQRDALLADIARADRGLWDSNDVDVAVQALASARDWKRLASLYDQRPASLRPCPDEAGDVVAQRRRGSGSVAVNAAQALLASGRREEADGLLACVDDRLRTLAAHRVRPAGFEETMVAFTRAQIQALRGRSAEAIRSLDQAVGRGWIVLYGGNLRDYPAFDSLPAKEIRRIQGKIDRQLARERAEIQRFCPNCR